MQVRPWTDDDRPWFDDWLRAHGEKNPAACIISPYGGMVEDDDGRRLMAGFLFLVVGVGVCWVERFVCRPGTHYTRSREAGALLLDYLSRLAVGNDYGVMYSHFTDPRMAREAARLGFVEIAQGVVSMARPLR